MKKTARNRPHAHTPRQIQPPPEGPVWLWGSHAVLAALQNPARSRLRLVATENAERRLALRDAEIVTIREFDRLLPAGAVHQGIALLTMPLEPATLDDVLAQAPARLAVLDQITDPHNLGAIFRSAAAFDFAAMILQTRHTPPITGAMVKSAAGAVETVREVRVVNIARTLEALERAGYRTIGLAGEATETLHEALARADKLAIVLGAEGSGLRPAVASACERLARIPMPGQMESLNVSNAAAIAFHECVRGAILPH